MKDFLEILMGSIIWLRYKILCLVTEVLKLFYSNSHAWTNTIGIYQGSQSFVWSCCLIRIIANNIKPNGKVEKLIHRELYSERLDHFIAHLFQSLLVSLTTVGKSGVWSWVTQWVQMPLENHFYSLLCCSFLINFPNVHNIKLPPTRDPVTFQWRQVGKVLNTVTDTSINTKCNFHCYWQPPSPALGRLGVEVDLYTHVTGWEFRFCWSFQRPL